MPSPHLQGVEFQTFAFDYIYFTFLREQTNTQIVFFQLWADGLCKVCRVLRLDLSPCSGQVGFPAKKETYLTELPFYHFPPGPTSTRMWSKAARSWRCFTRPLRYWHSFWQASTYCANYFNAITFRSGITYFPCTTANTVTSSRLLESWSRFVGILFKIFVTFFKSLTFSLF